MSETPLANRKCTVCHAGTPTLSSVEIESVLKEIPAWTLSDGRVISRTIKFTDFAAPMAAANRIAELAEEEGHHPDLHIHWGRLQIDLTTHAINGLSRNDFVMAAKIDRLLNSGAPEAG